MPAVDAWHWYGLRYDEGVRMALPPTFPTTILFIEDDLPLRAALCDVLKQWSGGQVQCLDVDSIDEALTVLAVPRPSPIDLIILDWRIAGATGPATIPRLRQALPPGQPMPPIDVISGNITAEEGLAAIQAGADAYRQKGADLRHDFLAMVQESWARRQRDWSTWQMIQRLEGPL